MLRATFQAVSLTVFYCLRLVHANSNRYLMYSIGRLFPGTEIMHDKSRFLWRILDLGGYFIPLDVLKRGGQIFLSPT